MNIFDIFAVLDGFRNDYPLGCETHNLDIAGFEGSCTPDGSVNIFDIFAVLDAFRGIDPCCGGGGQGDPCEETPPEPEIVLVTQTVRVGSEEFFHVQVFADVHPKMRSYQVQLELTGAQVDNLILEKIYVDDEYPGYVFANIKEEDRFETFDYANLRMGASLKQGGITGGKYLGTYVFKPAQTALQQLSVLVRTTSATLMVDPGGCGTEPEPVEVMINRL